MEIEARHEEQYRVLATRVANWHQLLWQVPLFAFTAQAFTFTIALDPEASRAARWIACGLSLLISVVSLATLVRQRKADKVDAGHLARIEEAMGWPKSERIHGKQWSKRRTKKKFDWRWLDLLFGRWKLTHTWAVAFILLIAAALLVAGLEAWWPHLLDGEALTA